MRHRHEVERFKRALEDLEEKHGFTIPVEWGSTWGIVDEEYREVWAEANGYQNENLVDETLETVIRDEINDALNRRD